MTNNTRKLVILFLGILLVFMYYLNNTYIFNLFDSEYPVLINRYFSLEINQIADPKEIFSAIQYNPRIISLGLFVVLVTTTHTLFVFFWTLQKKASVVYLIHIIVICALVLLWYVLYYLNPGIQKFYFLARVLKDYVQSPISLVLFLLLWRIYYTKRTSM